MPKLELVLPFLVWLPEALLVAPYFAVFSLVARWSLRRAAGRTATLPASAPA